MATEEQSRPGPGEEYNPGPAVTPRQAASVIVLRGGEQGLEVLLVQRTPKARFMGGVWVFPGGAVDAQEGDGDEAHRAAAIRELREEAAIDVPDPGSLIKFSRWITPKEVQIRFDTHFFLAEMPDGQEPPYRRRGVCRPRLVHARQGPGGLRGEEDRAGLPDHQAPAAARRVHHGRRPARSCARPRGAPDRASRRGRRRGRADPAPRRPRLRIGPGAAQACCCAEITCRDGVDQREMREGLGEVAQMAPAERRRAPRRRGQAARRVTAAARTVRARAGARRSRQRRDQPEGADQERALLAAAARRRSPRCGSAAPGRARSARRAIASTVARTRSSSAGRKRTSGISSVEASSASVS